MSDPLFPHAPADDSGSQPEVLPPPQGPYSTQTTTAYEPIWVPVATRRVRDRIWLHALLFAITVATTTLVGIGHWLSWVDDYGAGPVSAMTPWQILAVYAHHWYVGLWYSATILLILGAHELGHYFACRRYGINASLPLNKPVTVEFTPQKSGEVRYTCGMGHLGGVVFIP